MRLTGRAFPGSSLLPFVNIGHTVAVRQSLGTCPVAKDKLNRGANGSAINGARILRIFGCNPSGPGLLCTLSERHTEYEFLVQDMGHESVVFSYNKLTAQLCYSAKE